MDIIKAENVHYTYEDSGDSILRGIDLTVKEGEFLCILGHNGSGKSTLAKVLGGLFSAKRGAGGDLRHGHRRPGERL